MTLYKRYSALLLAAAVLTAAGCGGSPIRESTGEVIDDTVITTKVKAILIKDPVVRGRDVSVETFKGDVQLSGWVNSHAEAEQAATLARTVRGVKSVHNDIRVK